MDKEGKIIEKAEVPNLTKEIITEALHRFLGIQEQIPPMFSAKKIGGKKLYELARQNIEIDREPKEVDIKEIELVDFTNNQIVFRVNCSKGTYVRVLGSDIAKSLGTVGHLSTLIRNNVGKYLVNDSIKIEEFEDRWKNISA